MSKFKVGHGAICIKKTHKHNVGDVLLVSEISRGGLCFGVSSIEWRASYFTPCPNPPLQHYKERIAHALGAEIEIKRNDAHSGPINPAWLEDIKYSVAIPDIHAEEREKIKREIAQLQKKLDGLGAIK